jgi:SAM-dependent methyltransferase
MKNKITDSGYWDRYWSGGKIPSYDVTRGLFHSYDKLFTKYYSETACRLGKKDLRIVDFGCGEGLMLRYFKERFPGTEVWGIEFSSAFHTAEEVGRQLALEFNILKRDILAGIPSTLTNHFDIVLSVGLIEHFQDPIKILEIMHGALADGGCMITIIPSFEGAFNFFWRLCNRENYLKHVPISRRELRSLHEHLGLSHISIYALGTPTILGTPARSLAGKILQFIIVNINGRILQRLFPRQIDLEHGLPLAPILACAGYHERV